MANLLNMQQILGGIQQQYPVTPPTQPSAPTPTANPNASRNEKLSMMLYALGGALKGDEDFVVKTLQFKEMQEGKKKEKEQKEAWEKALKNLEGEVQPSLLQLAKALGPERGTGLIEAGLPRQQKQTAALQNLEAFKTIQKTGTPEEIKIAEAALIGIRQGKSKEQLRNEVIASLSKQTNSITGEPFTKEEIVEQVKILDSFFQDPVDLDITPNVPESFNVDGYVITPEG